MWLLFGDNMSLLISGNKSKIIDNYNFQHLRWKIAKNETNIDGLILTQDNVDLAIREYRRYLLLKLENPGTPLGPTALMDLVWHYHILDTKKYIEFCEKVFDGYLHHSPFFGPHSPTGEQDRMNDSRELMIGLYSEKFGDRPINCTNSVASCDGKDCDCCG